MPTIDRPQKSNWRDNNFLSRELMMIAAADLLMGFELISISQRARIVEKIEKRAAKIRKSIGPETGTGE